ncbi:centrosomal protein of 152 kDa-like [Rhopilema esculentum]|uniref:centrosomal protein of 152 kDa-like n=1 Tax=Rhopilema esculentum TaxID=499914 RepID=UPI0031D93B3C
MSNFLSQLEINPQVAQNDDEEFQEEDIEREKEIKELLEHELNEDEFFEDDSSFASHQTSINSLIDPSFDYNQLPSLPNEGIRKELPAPLLTSRGSEFISRISPRYDSKRDGEMSNKATHFNRVLDKSNKDVNQGEDAFAVLGYDGQDFSGKIDFSNDASNHERSPYVDSYTKSLGQRHFFEGHEHFETIDNRSDERGSFQQNQQSSFIKDSFMRHFDDNTENEDVRIHDVEGHVGSLPADFDYHMYSENQNQPLEEWQETPNEQYHENTPDNGTQSHDQSQLRILYEARGRKIESLQRELDVKTEDQAKEIRILQHKLSLAKGERDGMSMTLQHSQDSLQEMKLEINALQRRLSEEAENTKEVRDERKELLHKLEIAESGMEALNQQIVAMNRADSLSKMRSQHETIMATLRQKHEEEILLLKEKLDDTRKELNWKTEDVNRLQDEMQSAKKYITQLKVESAETVNKLTESLEQSQHRLRGMLAEGSDNSNTDNKAWLMQAKKENTNLLEDNKALKDEIRDVKEQLRLYEVALNSTIEGPSSSTPYSAHDVAQKLHQLDAFKTPLSRFAKDNRLNETNTNSIREDLIKALASNKTRREELNNAKMQINSLKEQLEELSADKNRIQMMNEALKAENDAISVGLKDTKHQISEEKPDTNEKLSALKQKLELSEAKVESLEKQLQQEQSENTVLRSEMSEMIRQFDKDKIDALKSCEKTYTKFNEDSKQHLEERLNLLHEQEVTELKDEIQRLKRELLDVKDSYVSLANENREISEQVRAECETENALHLKELTEKLTEEHKEEVHKLEECMLGESYTQVEELRKKLKDDFEEETKHRIETAIALAKVEWFARYEEERSDSIQRTVEATKMKFDRERDLEEEK